VTPVSELASAWEPAPAVLAGSILALVLFGQAFARLRRRGRTDHAGWDRAALFVLGVAILTLALVSPLDAAGEQYLLSAHMLQHVLIGDAAAALIMVAVRGPLLFFLLPGPALGRLARFPPLRAALSFLVRPLISVGAWALVLAVWHVPAIYDHALSHQAVHDLEHVTFVVAGLLVWFQLVDPARRAALSRAGRLGLAVAVFAAGQVLTMVLIFSFDPLYPAYAGQPERLLRLSPVTDQRLAGVVMMVEQLITLGTCVAFLLLAAERERRVEAGAASLTPEPRP
jgi:cytochrome c oxidase assembly factor CtaG